MSSQALRDAMEWLEEELALAHADIIRHSRVAQFNAPSQALWRRFRSLQTVLQELKK